MATAKQFVEKAASQIGVKESPAGSNKQKYGRWYGMNGQPWCDMFVSWCADQVGAGAVVGKYAYTPSHAAYAKKLGRWVERGKAPKAGDVVFFHNKSRICHVGIVEKVIDSNTVQTIEGNTSTSSNDNGGKVMRRTRKLGAAGSSWYIAGFFRPAWDKAKKAETAYTKYRVTASVLNFREGPGTKYAVTRKLKKGKKISVSKVSKGWARAKKGDYCSAKYIEKV